MLGRHQQKHKKEVIDCNIGIDNINNNVYLVIFNIYNIYTYKCIPGHIVVSKRLVGCHYSLKRETENIVFLVFYKITTTIINHYPPHHRHHH